jgi:hypothetical protein
LLSLLPALVAGQPVAPPISAGQLEAHSSLIAAPTMQASLAAATASPSGGIGSIGRGGPPLLGQGQPTPHELARDTFRAWFNGPLLVGSGRFTDQAKIVYIRGVGSANFFLHGDLNLGVVIPTDPSAPFTGVAVLQDENVNSSGIVGLDLTGSRQDVDRRGRPTHLTFTADPNIYSGIFFTASGTGSVDIQYHGNTATARFTGLVYTSGLTNPLKNALNFSRGGRTRPRG